MKDWLRAVLTAGFAILAVALAAPTLTSPSESVGSGSSGPAAGGGAGEGGLPAPAAGTTPGETIQIPFLPELLGVLAFLAVLACIGYAVFYRREAIQIVVGVAAVIGFLYLVYLVLSSLLDPSVSPMFEILNDTAPGATTGDGGGESSTDQPSSSVLWLVIFGLALVGVVVAVVKTRGHPADGSGEPAEDDGREPAAIGRAAGRAADRLEREATANNEVFRTWRAMVGLLDIDDPDTTTPGEFASAAIDAGLGSDDVSVLTRLFEDVRYGDTPPTEEYERRAIRVFRRIEDRYAQEDG